jgi:hypothetical protein
MSFFDARMSHFRWASSLPLPTSVRPEQGCVQCGSRLDPVEIRLVQYSPKRLTKNKLSNFSGL